MKKLLHDEQPRRRNDRFAVHRRHGSKGKFGLGGQRQVPQQRFDREESLRLVRGGGGGGGGGSGRGGRDVLRQQLTAELGNDHGELGLLLAVDAWTDFDEVLEHRSAMTVALVEEAVCVVQETNAFDVGHKRLKRNLRG